MASNPAVRRVTDWKKAFSPFCQRGMSPKVAELWDSSRKKNTVPASSRPAVSISTIFV